MVVPVMRAFAMAAVVTLGLMLGRRAVSLRTLALAATVVLLLEPAALLGASFQLSFAAVLALIAAWEASRGWRERLRGDGAPWRRVALFLAATLATSLIAGAATTPFGLHHFGRLQWYGVVANALAVPLTTLLIMPAGIVALLLLPFGLEAWPLRLMGGGVELVLWTARSVAAWPGAAESATPLPGWGLAIAACGLLWLCLWQARHRLLGVLLVLLGLGSMALTSPPDLLVSADGRVIALRTAAGLHVEQTGGASAFTREAFARSAGEAATRPLPRDGSVEGIVCTPERCIWRGLLLLRPQRRDDRPIVPDDACLAFTLIVSAAPLRNRCAELPSIDRFSVWRDGPHAAWLGPRAAVVLSDRAHRGRRRWVPPPPLPRAGTGTVPPAAVE
jgi:competence protein ComEC